MQTQTDIAPHLETLKKALGDKFETLDEQDLKDELQKYLEYGVPGDQAVRTILRHHGVQGGAPPAAPARDDGSGPVKIGELPPNVPFVNLLARFVTLNTKTVNARGEEKLIYWGLLGDETGTVPYTSWRPLEGLEKGDVVTVRGAYTKEFRNEVQVNFGDRTVLEKTDEDAIPKVAQTFKDVEIGELREGLRGLRVTGRILDVAPRNIMVQGESKTIYGGSLADTTGKVEFTSWHDHGLVAESVVTIEGAYVRAYRGVPQLNFDSDATVTVTDAKLPAAEELDQAARVTLGDLTERGGGNDVAVVATLLEVRRGSGLVFRDPETNRVIPGGGKDDGSIPDLRIKAILDDGTGAVNLVAGREITEELLGKNLDTCMNEAREAFRHEVIQDQLEEKLNGRVYLARGNVLSDEYGLMFIARSLQPHTEDTEAGAADLVATLPTEAL